MLKAKKQKMTLSPEEILSQVGLRPTQQRVLLAKILFSGDHKHVTADQVMASVRRRRGHVSLATVYNTLNQFSKAGLLREVSIDQSCTYFDTNLDPHHHFYDVETGDLWDVPDKELLIKKLPKPPKGREISRIDITVHLGKKSS